MSNGYADLHLHTTASDGTQGITELVGRAAACGLSCIAITDHDAISPQLHHRTTQIAGLEVITGVELKVDFDGIRGELLGYFIDSGASSLRDLLTGMRQARVERMAQMAERCRSTLGTQISLSDVRSIASISLGRPHLARLLVEKSVVSSMREAFDRFIGEGKSCYVPLKRPNFRAAASAIHTAGGVTSIPHPCLMRVPDWDKFLEDVHTEGVDAVEVFYPYGVSGNALYASPEMITSLTKKQGLLLTGGSDDHGPGSVKETLGSIKLPCRHVEGLRRACTRCR